MTEVVMTNAERARELSKEMRERGTWPGVTFLFMAELLDNLADELEAKKGK